MTYQEVPEAPMTVMGLQVTPTRPVTLPALTPKRPRRTETTEEVADWVLLQHWTVPLLHWLLGEELPSLGTGVAAARVATARAVRAANFIFARLVWRGLNECG